MRARPVAFRSGELILQGELVEADGAAWTVVLCHGIPGGRPDPTDGGYAGLARALAGRGVSAFWFDFRGARGAPGDFSIGGWHDDLRAALDAVAPLSQPPVAIVGSSAGGAAAIVVASTRPDVAAVATLAAPANYDALADDPSTALHRFRNLGIIRDPSFPRDENEWARELRDGAALAFVGAIAPRPVLIVHGDVDDVVPYAHAEMLFEKAGEPKELVRLPRGAHQLRRDPRAVDAVLDWLTRLARPGRPVS